MALKAGSRFGSCRVVAPIGAGGMGEVYRATDETLERDVALKVLPQSFAADASRVARFEQEAKTLAALNHANIAQIYGLERADHATALIMELVDGPTLAERIAEGPLPADEALGVAYQIAAALEAAHARGIVHRDLKPANVKLKADGTVKVLDFGIAKALAPETGNVQSPALTTPVTQAGIILGTAAYMSPEQARGKEVDQRADIWAFGCVLYEMLTGQLAFGGEDAMVTLARVLDRDTDLDSLPGVVTPPVRRAIELCLEKDPARRIADIRDVRLALEGRFETRSAPAAGAAALARPGPRRALVPVAALGLGAALAALGAWRLWPAPSPALPVTRFSIDLEGPITAFEPVALAPDGSRIAYAANGRLYSHRLDQDVATPIPGTEQGENPFFSPGGDSLGFFTASDLRVVGFGGEAPRTLASIGDAPGLVGAWDAQGRIFFGKGGSFEISRVAAVGGTPEPFAERADYVDVDFPDVLPGGEWVLFTGNKTQGDWSGSDLLVQHVDTGERKVVLEGGHFARYAPTGHIVFARHGALHAAPFDAARAEVTGPAVPVVQGVATDENSGHAKFVFAANGTLVYAPGTASGGDVESTLVGVSRDGTANVLSTELRNYGIARVGPEGERLAVEVLDLFSGGQIWVMSLATGGAVQLTFEGTQNRYPVWTPDGRDILFVSNRDGGDGRSIYRKAADGSGQAERVLDGTDRLLPTDVLAGNVLVYQDTGEAGRRDILTYDLEAGGPPEPFLATPADEAGARGSPDGNWMVYVAEESGRNRVYARPYPRTEGGLRAVSEGVGTAPVWSPSGDEVLFIGSPPGPMMSIPVEITPTNLTPGRPQELFGYVRSFQIPGLTDTAPYDVSPTDGSIIAVRLSSVGATDGDEGGSARPRLNVVLSWFEELQSLVPADP